MCLYLKLEQHNHAGYLLFVHYRVVRNHFVLPIMWCCPIFCSLFCCVKFHYGVNLFKRWLVWKSEYTLLFNILMMQTMRANVTLNEIIIFIIFIIKNWASTKTFNSLTLNVYIEWLTVNVKSIEQNSFEYDLLMKCNLKLD